MARSTPEDVEILTDFSGAVQRKSSKFLRAKNELGNVKNARFVRTGGISKAPGYTKKGDDLESTSSTTSSSTSTSTSTSTSSSTTSSSTSSSSTTTA